MWGFAVPITPDSASSVRATLASLNDQCRSVKDLPLASIGVQSLPWTKPNMPKASFGLPVSRLLNP
ncbi:hypothetical protein ANRL1_04785 [Anaerolineae bacterium]|nr:hypothetical protein ANRL1_04785 [Anaerolineae bacterium]